MRGYLTRLAWWQTTAAKDTNELDIHVSLCMVSRNAQNPEGNLTGIFFTEGHENISVIFLSSGKLSVKHEIGPRVIWETNQYTYMWVTYLSLSSLAHINGETSLLSFQLDLPSSLFHQHTTLKITQICNITQRAKSSKTTPANQEKSLEHCGIFISITKIGSYIPNNLWWMVLTS